MNAVHESSDAHDVAHHGHLWRLPDGTGLHAPAGELTVDDETGRLCCHLCGQWWTSLGAHVRIHGYTAAAYRQAMSLCTGQPLTAATLSATISHRQATAYRRDQQLRDRLNVVEPLRRSGELAVRARHVLAETDPIQRRSRRRAAQRAGRETLATKREQALQQRIEAAGYSALGRYLHDLYAEGCSLEDLARATGLGRSRLRYELDTAGVLIRGTGQNTEQGRRSRAQAADRAAALKVGTDDLHRWLEERRTAGWSLVRIAEAVGHSTPWVRQRLARRLHAVVAS